VVRNSYTPNYPTGSLTKDPRPKTKDSSRFMFPSTVAPEPGRGLGDDGLFEEAGIFFHDGLFGFSSRIVGYQADIYPVMASFFLIN
jgi:hypothetical protein